MVQTRDVLYQPWVLYTLYEAARRELPIICVHVVGGGYAFDDAQRLLADLKAEIPLLIHHSLTTN